MALNFKHLQQHVIEPVVQRLGMYSPQAVSLLLGTAAQESGGVHLVQLGGGPALGIFQMEPRTHDCIWENYLLASNKRGHIVDAVRSLMVNPEQPDATEMVGNLLYAAAMCRLHYYRVREAIPESLEGQAAYWKRYYNTYHPNTSKYPHSSTEAYIKNYKRLVI